MNFNIKSDDGKIVFSPIITTGTGTSIVPNPFVYNGNNGQYSFTMGNTKPKRLVIDLSYSRGNYNPIYNFPFKSGDILYVSNQDGNLYEDTMVTAEMYDYYAIPKDGYYSISITETQLDIQQVAHFNGGTGPMAFATIQRPQGLLNIIEPLTEPVIKHCMHEWKTYTGLIQKYDYCIHCDHKKYE